MMKRRLVRIILPFFSVFLVSILGYSAVLAAKTYRAERFDVQVDLQGNGLATVTETIAFRFEGGDFTYAYRDISAANTDGVAFLGASMDGASMPQGTGAGQVEVQDGDPLKVTWHFAPTSNAAHVFVVQYQAKGVIRKNTGGDVLIWRAIPEEHDYPIDQSTVLLKFPAEAKLLAPPTLSSSFETTEQGLSVMLSAQNIDNDQDLVLTARFSPGVLAQTSPGWQAMHDQTTAAVARLLPVGLFSGLVTLVLGGFGLYAYARAKARPSEQSPMSSYFTPPGDLYPGLAGKLIGSDEGFMGTVFDLAQRNMLEINEQKGFAGTKKYIVVRKDSPQALNAHEKGLLAAMFKPGQTQASLSEVGQRLAMKKSAFDKPLENEMLQRGWLDPQRRRKRTDLIFLSLFAMFTSMGIFIAGIAALGELYLAYPWILVPLAVLSGFGAAGFILSIPVLIYAASFSILTSSGEQQAARWKSFAAYLRAVARGQESAIRPDFFEKYLGYAAGFGLGPSWAKTFQKLGGVPLPAWFHAMAGSSGDFGAIVAVMSASHSAAASAGAGGAGASGGGSSGAG